MSIQRMAFACALALSAVLLSSSTMFAAGLPRVVNGKHVMWAAGQGYPDLSQASNLIFHGGTVETTPAVYLVYWGTEWQAGFSTTQGSFTYTSATVQTYVNTVFSNVGGSPWAGVQTQFCQSIMAPAFSCTGQAGAALITNPTGQLKGTWTDPTPVPSNIVTTGLAFMPYVPEQGAGCGANSVNATDDAFGHGYLDGYSIVAGHEYAEAVTDPGNLTGYQDGWNDAQSSENGDKCAWTGLQNITLAGQTFAVQPMWSNEANGGQGGCAVTR